MQGFERRHGKGWFEQHESSPSTRSLRPIGNSRSNVPLRTSGRSSQPLTETVELKYVTSQDNNENIRITPYGVVFSISRQMLMKDDLGAIDEILSR